jgi:MFS family permease
MLYACSPRSTLSSAFLHWCRRCSRTRAPGFKGIVDGFRYLRTNTVVMVSLLVDVIAMVFGMPRALFPQIAVETFDGPDEGGIVFSLLFAALAGGSAVAGIFSGWVSRVERQGLAVITAIIVWGSAMVLFGLSLEVASSLWTLALITALFGLGLGGGADIISSAFRSTMLQEAATDDMRGRMQGVFIVVVAGGPRLGRHPPRNDRRGDRKPPSQPPAAGSQ